VSKPIPCSKAAANANTIKQVGPLGGLGAGVIAGVIVPTFPNGATGLGSTGPTGPTGPIWVKARTIQTANGPVDVDANGIAEDGSTPTTVDVITPKVFTATDGTVFENESTYNKYEELLGEKKSISDTKRREGESAYNLLYKTFSEYGLGSLVEPLQKYIVDGLSDDEFTLRLRETPAYQKRFGANKQRIAKGLSALDEATYIKMEDKYQDVMRQYGLPASYYEKDSMGTQKGFEDLISNDVSNVELEERLLVAQDRVLKSDPNVLKALKDFYPDIKNGDILAYTLDPKNAIKNIQSKVTAAEIGGAALSQNLTTNLARAEELQKMGVDKAAAVEGYSTIGGGLQRGSELASIYGESPYTQATAESEVFKLTGQTEARKQRQKVTGLEKAAFGGQSGVTSGALARDRAGGY
jgi:hypothetical protein